MSNAIVIFYEGDPLDVIHAELIISALAELLSEGNTQPVIKAYTDDQLAKELIKTSQPPKQSTEDGDASVKVIMGMLPIDILENRLSVAIMLTKILTLCETKVTDEKSKAFMQAMSYLSQGTPVSKKVAKDYHFTKMISEVIKEVYTNYISR